MKLLLKSLLCLVCVGAIDALAAGDATRGAEKAVMCASCHGVDGNSTVAMWPKLAGQHAPYLERQLHLIKSGARPVPEMMGIAAMLSDEDIADTAAYYAAQESAPAVADEQHLADGARIWRAGDADKGLPACMACHGPAGEGNPLAGYPALAGQHAQYTAKMLDGFRDGHTWGDEDAASQVMVGVAESLTKPEIEAVASYVQGLYSQDDQN